MDIVEMQHRIEVLKLAHHMANDPHQTVNVAKMLWAFVANEPILVMVQKVTEKSA